MVVRLSDISSKWPKNTKNTFFVCFWAYVGQPYDHISWAVPMPFASINSTIPRTNPWKFHEKILRIGGVTFPLFEVWILLTLLIKLSNYWRIRWSSVFLITFLKKSMKAPRSASSTIKQFEQISGVKSSWLPNSSYNVIRILVGIVLTSWNSWL